MFLIETVSCKQYKLTILASSSVYKSFVLLLKLKFMLIKKFGDVFDRKFGKTIVSMMELWNQGRLKISYSGTSEDELFLGPWKYHTAETLKMNYFLDHTIFGFHSFWKKNVTVLHTYTGRKALLLNFKKALSPNSILC